MTKQSIKKYFQDLINLIDKKVDNNKILDGIGALVDDSKREWVKNNLKKEVIKQLAINMKVIE
ncbi:MAG: hypothetical protein U9Q85_00155 [Patescibacteria group bacterium]|nr:hypothetical protein [Patescibacteria group bacterium]